MSELREILADTLSRQLDDVLTVSMRTDAEQGVWPASLWTALEVAGVTHALDGVAHGGPGAAFEDVFAIAYHAGHAAAPVPLVETMVANGLLSRAGIAPRDGVVALIAGASAAGLERRGSSYSGTAANVPWGRDADAVVLVKEREVALFHASALSIELAANVSGEPRDKVRFDEAVPEAMGTLPEGFPCNTGLLLAAMARSAQMAGAASWVLDETLQYANNRVQFGRPLGKIQAIQHYLATLASRVAQATTATEHAFSTCDLGLDKRTGAELDIASAKIVVGEAAESACAVGHQIHGAIGFTREYALHYRTRRLMAWRAEFGSESYWAERLGQQVVARGAEQLWPDITAKGEDR